jgi:hypothetical protein
MRKLLSCHLRRRIVSLMNLLAVAVAVVSTNAFAEDPCGLLDRSDVASLLGQPVIAAVSAGPEQDEDSGGRLSYCTYRASTDAMVVSVVEFASAAEARKQLSANLVEERMDADDAKVSEEPGIGERCFWGSSSNGVSITFVKGTRVAGIAMGGEGVANPLSRKAALRDAALAVASKL